MAKGWRNESRRHSLASKGIKTAQKVPKVKFKSTPIKFKKYKCSKCGFVKEIDTNHYGECYSWGHSNTCPNCPPYAKYPEYGGSTTWKCMEKPPKPENVPEPWKKVKLGDIAEIKRVRKSK